MLFRHKPTLEAAWERAEALLGAQKTADAETVMAQALTEVEKKEGVQSANYFSGIEYLATCQMAGGITERAIATLQRGCAQPQPTDTREQCFRLASHRSGATEECDDQCDIAPTERIVPRRRGVSTAAAASTSVRAPQPPQPDGFRRNLSRGNRAFLPVLPVEFLIEGIIEKHAAEIEQGGAGRHENQALEPAFAAENPAGEAVGPDGGQVGGPAQDEQGAQVGGGIKRRR